MQSLATILPEHAKQRFLSCVIFQSISASRLIFCTEFARLKLGPGQSSKGSVLELRCW
ncbi:hypothetical protein SAMN06265222_101909 [Neorhodopirellula lusitana]|uniref:Uncharacterized protein n=1 Tax=Neorhodopirellula lusitana TaxID=445327 RepID=A0ABY1PSY0_9BACT|nr:hypothetical protein SAMN06265222_101909 [Neorhodopirellula lusitana]